MDYPPFHEAVARFRSFLNDEGHRGDMGWLFPSDVLLVGGDWIIRPRPQETVAAEVESAYEKAVVRRLGIRFNAICFEGEAIWCYVFYPMDRIQAEHCMMP